MARIPAKSVSKDDTEVLQHLEETLKRAVYGQDEAVAALASAIKLARAGLRESSLGELKDDLRLVISRRVRFVAGIASHDR